MSLYALLVNTPWWVWLLFIYLMFRGYLATRTRVVPVYRLLIGPALLLGLLFYKGPISIVGLSLGIVGGFIRSIYQKGISMRDNVLVIPGSYEPLCFFSLFFCIKYIFGFLRATQHPCLEAIGWSEFFLTGFCSGYLLGRALGYVFRLLK